MANLGRHMEPFRTGSSPDDLPPMSHFLRSVQPGKLAALEPEFGKVGRLDVIGPDQGRNYSRRLSEPQIKDLSQTTSTSSGGDSRSGPSEWKSPNSRFRQPMTLISLFRPASAPRNLRRFAAIKASGLFFSSNRTII